MPHQLCARRVDTNIRSCDQLLEECADGQVITREHGDRRRSMRATVRQNAGVDSGMLRTSLDPGPRQSRTHGFYWLNRRRIERVIQIRARVWELNCGNFTLIQMFELPLRLRNRCG